MKTITWKDLTEKQKITLLQRPATSTEVVRTKIVRNIIKSVQSEGDKALIDLTEKYDKTTLNTLQVSDQEFEIAEKCITKKTQQALLFAIEKIKTYQTALMPKSIDIETTDGVFCSRQTRPIDRVGLYVPGGESPLISTAMMLAIPANIAGCKTRVLCTPTKSDGSIDTNLLFTAKQCGINTIFKIGGAQAIAAMAYGTETIPKVDKIFGPGNSWVTEAKKQVTQDINGTACDMPAGPSEVFIIADNNANPDFIASDLLSQAEHGLDSQVICVTTSETLAKAIDDSLQSQLQQLSRKGIIEKSLGYSQIILVTSIAEAISISNRYAPEHLILQVDNPEQYTNDIQNAAAVFLGKWIPETLGDYTTGSNHVLPTGGYAKSTSGLSVMDFMKYISFQKATQDGIKNIGPAAAAIAKLETLNAHANAVNIRLENINESNY